MKSKRQTTRIREKVKKRVREHNRKERRAARKHPHKAPTKDPGIPNMCPFKEEILKEAADRKRRAEEEKLRRREDRHDEVMKRRSLEKLQKDAEKRQKEFDLLLAKKDNSDGELKTNKSSSEVEGSRKAYYREFSKVLEASDVVIQVLDARDPIGSRCTELEQAVMASGANKKLVLLLNKIDLVPRDNVESWLKHLRNEFPAMAFKASTQTQRHNLSQSKVPLTLVNKELLQSSNCLGADSLIKLLSNYCRNADIKTAITVGIVGFPNVGKSSVINSLKRSKACRVGGTPGVTKSMQVVYLAKNIKLLDSPGVVLASDTNEAAMALHNCAKVETLDDPVKPVEAILKRCNKQQLMLHYNISEFDSVPEFLAKFAKRRGHLKKKGIPCVDKAARTVLNDWNSGKISFFTHVPEQHTLATHIKADIVTQMSKEFDIGSLQQEDTDTLKDLDSVNPSRMVAMETSGLTSGILTTPADEEEEEEEEADDNEEEDDGDEEYEDMENEENKEGHDKELGDVTVSIPSASSKSKSSVSSKGSKKKKTKAEEKAEKLGKEAGNQQLNKDNKLAFKKMLKKRKKSDKLAGKLSDELNQAMDFLTSPKSGGDAYDFSEHFSV